MRIQEECIILKTLLCCSSWIFVSKLNSHPDGYKICKKFLRKLIAWWNDDSKLKYIISVKYFVCLCASLCVCIFHVCVYKFVQRCLFTRSLGGEKIMKCNDAREISCKIFVNLDQSVPCNDLLWINVWRIAKQSDRIRLIVHKSKAFDLYIYIYIYIYHFHT